MFYFGRRSGGFEFGVGVATEDAVAGPQPGVDIVAAPSGPLNMDVTTVHTHQLGISVPFGRRVAASPGRPQVEAALVIHPLRPGPEGLRTSDARLQEAARMLQAEKPDTYVLATNRTETVRDFVTHIDYLVDLIGIDHVGISSDFDGGGGVTGWNGAEETFNVTLELVRRGYTEEQIAKIWSGNLLRVMAEVEKVAKQIQAGQK